MKQRFLWLLMSATVLAGTCLTAPAQSPKWVLDNGHVRRVVEFSADHGLTTVSWVNKETGTDFMRPSHPVSWQCQEFLFRADSILVTGQTSNAALAGEAKVFRTGSWQEVDVPLRALRIPINIVVHYAIYDGFAASRQWLTIENTGTKEVMLSNLTFQCQTMQAGPTRDLITFGHYGEQPRETYFTARVDEPAILVEDAKTKEGLAVLNEVPGVMRRTEMSNMWQPDIKSMYDTDHFPFERRLEPGEKFETAGSSIVFYQRSTASDPHWVLPEYARDAIAHNKDAAPADWMYNDWDPWFGGATADMLQGLIARAAQAGLNLFTIDEGWEKVLGDTDTAPAKFPHGLEPVFESMTQHGLKRGLWMSVALVSQNSKVYREHPEWVCRARNGEPKQSQGQGVVMSLASPYRDAAFERIAEEIRRYRLDYVKLDLTTAFNVYGEEPGCYPGDGHLHPTQQEAYELEYEAEDWIADRLHAEFPKLLIDYTFELWGGKTLIDYGLLRAADLDWLTNVPYRNPTDAGPLQVRTVIYQRALTIPVEDMLAGNMHLEVGGDWKEGVATAMAMAPVFLGDLRQISDPDLKEISDWIGRFRELSKHVSLSDSFFPLGAWRQPRVTRWDGYGRFARSGEGMIAIFRNDSTQTEAKVSIPGFPDGQFRIINWNGGQEKRVSGAQMRRGWEIPLSGPEKVMVLQFQKE